MKSSLYANPEITSEPTGKQNPRWEYSTISDYKPLVSTRGWKACPACNEFPRLWVFDNGRYARCLCSHKYEKDGAEAEAICTYVRRNNGSLAGYDTFALQAAWNKRCEEMRLAA